MLTQARESLRPLWAFVVIAGLVTTAHASLIPNDAEVYFSTNGTTLSLDRGLRVLRPGDVVKTDGKVAIANKHLVKQFQPTEKRTDFGLDGLTVFRWASGRGRPVVYFSTNTSFYSDALGKTVGDGDLLNKRGEIVATNQQLVAAFEPSSTANLGLDAFDVLSPGRNQEIWFSTSSSFHSDKLGAAIGAGDVLSTSGEIIATNADLLGAFRPQDAGRSYGLDSLYVAGPGDSPLIWFSTTESFYSEALKRTIGAGDLLSNTGQIITSSTELLGKRALLLGDNNLDAFTIVRTIEGNPGRGTDHNRPPSVPEPATLVLLALGVPLVAARRLK